MIIPIIFQQLLGFLQKYVDKHLLDVAFLSNELNRYVIVITYGIKSDLVYDKHRGQLIGFVNLGETNNRLKEFENAMSGDQSELPLASSMLVLMVRGLFFKLNYPYAQFACDSLGGDLLFDPIWEAISRLERLGFRVLALTSNGVSPNRRLWKLHSDDKDQTIYKVPNVFATEGTRYIFILCIRPPSFVKDQLV